MIRFKHKKLLGTVFLAVIVAVGLTGWYAWSQRSQEAKKDQPSVILMDMKNVPVAAQVYVDNNDVDGGISFLDGQVAERKDAKDKRALLIYKASFASTAKRYEVALDAAKQADDIISDESSYLAIAKAYEGMGNKKQAVTYYKKALEDLPEDGAASRYNAVWQQKIEELSR